MNIITYKIKSVYGNDMKYVQGDEVKAISLLTGKKTIDNKDIHALELLGFQVKEV